MNYIQIALDRGVTDTGQIPKEELREIRHLVRRGILRKGMDWRYSKPHPHYARTLVCKLNSTEEV